MAFLLYIYFKPMPQITIRHRSIEFYQFFGYRMNKTYMPGMQTDTSIRIGTWRTILQITFNRASHLCQLATNLMMTSGLKVDLKQEVISSALLSYYWEPPYHKHNSYSVFRYVPDNVSVHLQVASGNFSQQPNRSF